MQSTDFVIFSHEVKIIIQLHEIRFKLDFVKVSYVGNP